VGLTNHNERRCFLCLDHLPQEQKGILYRGEYLILCNPVPILSSHFTVSHLDHRSQGIEEHIGAFLQLITDLGPTGGFFTTDRNAGLCARPSPFSVARSGQMPIEKEIREGKRLALVKEVDDVLLYRVNNLGRESILVEGSDSMTVERAFKGFLNTLKRFFSLRRTHDQYRWFL